MKILSVRENSPKGEETAQKFLMSENVKKGEGVKKVHNLAPPRCVNFAIQGEDETLREKGEDPLYRLVGSRKPFFLRRRRNVFPSCPARKPHP